jgi:hypothetical protein
VTEADLANLANLPLRAEAQHPLALLATFATAVTNDAGKYIGSKMWSPPIAAAESSSSSGLYLCSYSLQARWSSQITLLASSS